MASSQSSPGEYHHFIPQFILKNFSHKHSPPQRGSKYNPKHRKKDKKTGLYPNDLALNIINLKAEVPHITEAPVKRTFGLMDMYRDISNTASHNYLEKELSKLESRVSSIIAEIRDALESGKSGFSMPRNQRDMLRKFLFIMKYRGPGFHRRFHGDESGNYDADDEDQFKTYMEENGYKKPVDVWFKSIKTILDLQMDLEGKWQAWLVENIYPDDAIGFILHTEWSFLAFCTPSDPNDEFILTENCYNVHEGPNSTILNPETGEYEVIAWTAYHEFSPITPKLMLLLRSGLLPNPEEDANENIKNARRRLYDSSRSLHADPATAKSILEDLPVKKPRNSYSQQSSEGTQLLQGEDGSRQSHHRFTFPFFKIGTDHVRKINCILLENAHLTSAIAFGSEVSIKESVKYFLELPALPDGWGFKLVNREKNDMRLVYLKKLESFLKSLGTSVQLEYQEAPGVDEVESLRSELRREALESLQKEMIKFLPKQPTEFMQLYNKLGGSPDTLFTDMDQAEKMRFLRIKIDVCTRGQHEARREKVRNNLRDIFCQLPARRLWIYLKSLRAMSLGTPETLKSRLKMNETMDGPEDIIVKASHVVRPDCLGLLLHFTVMQDIAHRKNPGLGPSSDFDFNEAGLQRARKLTDLTFSPVGSIINCGIKPIQQAATTVSGMFRFTNNYEKYANPLWTDDENIEILTRTCVRGEMSSILSKQLSEDVLEELSDVLFNIVYPAYAKIRTD